MDSMSALVNIFSTNLIAVVTKTISSKFCFFLEELGWRSGESALCYAILSTKVSDKHFFKLNQNVLFFLISHLKFILSFSLLSTCSFKLLSCNFSKIKFVP